jgi:hypothetical protein
MSSNPPGRQSQGRPVSQDQYAKERGIPGQNPMADPAGVSYPPGSAPLANPSMADSFFFQEPDKSSFMNDGQHSVMVNPYTQPQGSASNQMKKVTTTTVTTTQQSSGQKTEPKGFNNPYTSAAPAPPIQEAGRSTMPPQTKETLPSGGRSTAPSQFKLVSSKIQYDNTISPDADELLRKSGVTGASKIVATETVTKRETVNPAFQGKSLQERFDYVSTKTRDQEWKIHELEDKIASMMLERDKMINDYEAYIDKVTMEKEELKGLEGLVKKLETEKEFLENEIEKVRSIKLMLENQLNAYNENAEIQRFRGENDKLKEDMKRLKQLIYVETGQSGDPNKLDIRSAVTKFKTEVTVVQQENQRIVSERNDLLRKIAVLEDELKFNQGDAFNEIKSLKNTIDSYKKQIANLQEAHADTKRTEAGSKAQLSAKLKMVEQENETLRKSIDTMRNNMKHVDDSFQTQEIKILRERIQEMTVNTPHVGEVEKFKGQLLLQSDKVMRLEERNRMLEEQIAMMAESNGEGNNQALVNQIRALNERVRAADQQNFELHNRLMEANRQIDELRRNQVTNMTQTNYSGSALATNNRGNLENRGPGGNYLGTGGVNVNNNSRVETTTVTTEFVHLNDGAGGQLSQVTPVGGAADDYEPLNSQGVNRVIRKKQVQFAPENTTHMYQYGSEGPEAGDQTSTNQNIIRKTNTTFINNASNIEGSSLSFGQNSNLTGFNTPMTFAGNNQSTRYPGETSTMNNQMTTINETHYEYYIDESGQQQRKPLKSNKENIMITTNQNLTVFKNIPNQGVAPLRSGSFGDINDFDKASSNNQLTTNTSTTVIRNNLAENRTNNFAQQNSHLVPLPILVDGQNQANEHHATHITQTTINRVNDQNTSNSNQGNLNQTHLIEGGAYSANQGQSMGTQAEHYSSGANAVKTNQTTNHHSHSHHHNHHSHSQHNNHHANNHQHTNQSSGNWNQQSQAGWGAANQTGEVGAGPSSGQVQGGGGRSNNGIGTVSANIGATSSNTANINQQQQQMLLTEAQLLANNRGRLSPSRLPEQLPPFPTNVLEPSFVRQTVDLAEHDGPTNPSAAQLQPPEEKTGKLEGMLAKKQREIDDLLMRVFLLAAENDRLRNEDQLLQNIRVIRNSPLVQRSMEVNKAAREKDPVHHESNTYHSITKVIPPINSVGVGSAQPIGQEYPRASDAVQEVRTTTVGSASAPGYNPWHAEQAYENKDNSDIHLYQRHHRNNRDVESIIQEVYEKHGLTKELSSSKPNPHRPAIASRIEQTYALAQSTIPAHELRKTELEDYFKKINQKLMDTDSTNAILERVASPDRDLKHDSQLGATVLNAEHA